MTDSELNRDNQDFFEDEADDTSDDTSEGTSEDTSEGTSDDDGDEALTADQPGLAPAVGSAQAGTTPGMGLAPAVDEDDEVAENGAP